MTKEHESPLPPLKARGKNPLIILVGRDGLLKRSLANRTARAYPDQCALVPSMTDRGPRLEDEDGEFEYVLTDIIQTLLEQDRVLESHRSANGHLYARTSEIISAALVDHIGIAILTAANALRVRDAGFPCYLMHVRATGETPSPVLLSQLAEFKVVEDLVFAPDEPGFVTALLRVNAFLNQFTRSIKTSRPPPMK